jgi:transcription initiation factor IIE alpha subunit
VPNDSKSRFNFYLVIFRYLLDSSVVNIGMNYSSNFLAEKFVQTVARAFYVDSVVVVLDALIREKFVREEELGPRLRMSQKQAREAVALLVDVEMLVRCEEVPLHVVDSAAPPNSKQVVKFYYIDYQAFANVVRLRVYHMLKAVQSEEKKQVDDIYYQCPTCMAKYSSLEAMRQRSKDFKFVCPSCCPDFDLSNTISQPSFRLREVDNRGKLSDVQKLEKKIREQISRSVDHDGILEMLEDLKDCPLPRNKPSSNLHRGIRSSAVKSGDISDEITQNVISKNTSARAVDIKDRHFNLLSTRLDGTQKEIEIQHIEEKTVEDVKVSSDVTDDESFQAMKRARQAELPVFLQQSGVKGSSAIMQEVHSLHVQRGLGSASDMTRDGNKMIGSIDDTLGSVVFARDARAVITVSDNKEANDDIDWEDEDES